MNAKENFCGRCNEWIGPTQGDIRVERDRVEVVCDTCSTIEQIQQQEAKSCEASTKS